MLVRVGVVSHAARPTSGFAASHVQDAEEHQQCRRASEEENNQSQKQKVLLLCPPVAPDRRVWSGQTKRCLVCPSGPGGERKAEGGQGRPHEEEGVSNQGAGDAEEAAR